VEKDVVTYTALISACNKGRQWERALAVNREMQQRGVRENEVTYATLVEAAGNAGQVEVAIELFERAMAAGFMQCYTPLGAPLPLGSERYDTVYGVDLHGCSETICRICMLSWLRQLKRGQTTVMQLDQPYMEIITGWGKNSKVLGVSKVSRA
jgi:pentatricopeptide repeat protein